ncbi:ATP-dependent RNA helicase DeaD [Candidatus Magnetomoraceae bacterium gMMP-15]
MTNEFSQLNLHPKLLQNIAEIGYTTPTPVQSTMIPSILTGRDVIGQSQTGTGKTAAFAFPILNNLEIGQNHVQSLVLAPTRELAMQVTDAMYKYGRYLSVRVLAVYGGQPYSRQISRLRKGVDIVVGTPGRLLDLIQRKVLDLSNVSTVVLDEADEMLSMGFISDIEAILKETPSDRQTALFSATLPKEILRLSKRYMHDPKSFKTKCKQLTVTTVDQRCYLVNESDKLAALTRLFEVEEITSALIFARTRLGTGELANELTARGFPAEALNGDMNQDARVRTLNRFRNNHIKVLVATDVAARGLDIDDISHVFNYDLPQDPEIYVHRIGRTGRAGKTGIAISLLTPKEQWFFRKIETYTKQKITKFVLPTVKDITTHRETRLVEQMMVWLDKGHCNREQEIVAELVEKGRCNPIEIAAAALKMARSEEKQRPIAPVGEVKELRPKKTRKITKRGNRRNEHGKTKNSHEKGMVRLTLSKGKADGIRINHVVGTISHYAKIPGNSIGKISIQKQHTFIDVPEKLAGQVLAKTGAYRIGRQTINVKAA